VQRHCRIIFWEQIRALERGWQEYPREAGGDKICRSTVEYLREEIANREI